MVYIYLCLTSRNGCQRPPEMREVMLKSVFLYMACTLYLGSLQVLHKYVALCASQRIRDGSPLDALRLYADYGAPPLVQNFNIYRHITASVFALPGLYGAHAYRTWSELRDVLHDLVSWPCSPYTAPSTLTSTEREYCFRA